MNPLALAYLAVPYSDVDEDIRNQRVKAYVKTFYWLQLHTGYSIVSAMSALVVCEHYKLPDTWDFWGNYGESLIAKCDKLYILVIRGWKESKGVQGEIELAKKYNIPISYLFPGDPLYPKAGYFDVFRISDTYPYKD